MPSPAVETIDLVKRYGPTAAADHLSFEAPSGRVTALLGPNGAGKTTTVEICAGFRRPDAGRARVLGLDPARDGRELRPRVGVMLQEGGVANGSRADEMLRTVARFHAHPVDPDLLIDRLGLRTVIRTPFRRLSGGQRQRLSLAMAVVGRPELAFLDEPTAGLDPQARHATWDLVEELRASGVSVVLTTHDMEEAEQLADHVVIVDRGRVVANGSPHALTHTEAERQLRFRARPGLDLSELLGALPAGTIAKESPAGHYLIEGDIGPQLLASVTAWCASHDILAEDLRVESRTLEDVFLELTGRGLRS
ncbi:MAG: ABC transporter ATP-binding protein [Streptosporangiaceae bacterium]